MAIIVTNPNWVQIDGNRLQKGSRDLHPIKNGVRLTVPGGSDNWDILVNDTTIDGVAVSDSDELMAFFEAQGFRNGGGDGSGVTWDQVTDKPLYTLGTPIQDAEGLIPVYTQNGQLPVGIPEFPENAVPLALLDVRAPNLEEGNFLVGGEDGNEQRRIVGTDLNITQTTNAWYVARWNPVEQEWGGTAQLVPSSPNTLVIRTSAGQGKFQPAINNDEAVVLSQFEGISNDALTDQETSITLNALYPNIAIGTVVTAGTAGMEYRKVDIDTWTKKPIEII